MDDAVSLKIHVERAYLELARAHLYAQIGPRSLHGNLTIPGDVVWALSGMSYVFSYAAVNAFVTSQLYLLWNEQSSVLRREHPDVCSFDELIKKHLTETKDMIKTLCRLWGVKQLCDEDSVLWNELINVCGNVRDFVIHPKPTAAFGKNCDNALARKSWAYPGSVAARVLAFFYRQKTGQVPSWIANNETFRLAQIELIDA